MAKTNYWVLRRPLSIDGFVFTTRISLSQSRLRLRFELKSTICSVIEQTRTVQFADYVALICSIIELTKISVFDFVPFNRIQWNDLVRLISVRQIQVIAKSVTVH